MEVRAGHVAVELGEVYLDPVNVPGKDTSQEKIPVRAALSDELR